MIIQSKRVYMESCFIKAAFEIKDKKIHRFYRYGSVIPDIDFEEKRVVPGFIDVHCHGAFGWDTNEAGEEGLRKWAYLLPDEGVTGFCPTTVTQEKDNLMPALDNVRRVKDSFCPGRDGADILGIHFEGPFINAKYGGAQPASAIRLPSVSEFEEYRKASGDNIRIITLAPEMDKDHVLIRYCSKNDIRVSMGHTGASFEEAVLSVADGAVCVTHTFNAQTPFLHRENGMVGAALRLKDLYSEVICDGIHSTPEALHIFFTSKGRSKAIMITDSLLCKGCEDRGQTFLFGGNRIQLMDDGLPHLTDYPNHPLAGSVISMNQGLKNLVEKAMVPFDVALNSCTINPATMLGLDDHMGKLKAGYDADIVVLNDDYSIFETYCKGIARGRRRQGLSHY